MAIFDPALCWDGILCCRCRDMLDLALGYDDSRLGDDHAVQFHEAWWHDLAAV